MLRNIVRLRRCQGILALKNNRALTIGNNLLLQTKPNNNENRCLNIPYIRWFHISSNLGDEIVEIAGPAFAESITEGDIRWIKQQGDFVNPDDLVAEIETDKTSVEVPAPFSGTIVELLVEDGSKVSAKQKLYKLKKGEADASAKPIENKGEEVRKKEIISKAAESIAPSLVEKKVETKINEAIPSSLPSVPIPPKTPISSQSVLDIPIKPSAGLKAPVNGKYAITGDRSETHVKMNRMRQRIAQRLKDAQNTNAMLTTFNEVDMSLIMALRKKYQDAFTKKHGIKLGLMSPFVRASALALQDQPVINAVIEGEEIIYRNFVDISVAVATPRGLVVPVMRNVESMSFADIEKTLSQMGTLIPRYP